MTARLVLALGLVFSFSCGPASDIDASHDNTSASAERVVGPAIPITVNLWTTTFPTNPDSSPAPYTAGDTVDMNGCHFVAVVHHVTFQSWVGLIVSPISLKSCPITKALGGNAYTHIGTYNGPTAYARVAAFAALNRLVFASSGSAGPSGIATTTMASLTSKLLDASNANVLRSHVQSVCASGPGGQILPTTTWFVDPSTGLYEVGGTENAPSGLPGDAACPQVPSMTTSTFTLHYAGFASGAGAVAAPTFTP